MFFNRKGLDLNCSDVSVNCHKIHLTNLPHLLPPTFSLLLQREIEWLLGQYIQGLCSVWARSHNRRGMLEVENVAHVFSPKVTERWPETSMVLGRGICTEDEARQMFTLRYSAWLLMYFPNPTVTSCWLSVKIVQVVREKKTSLN